MLLVRENRTVEFNAVGENPLRAEEGDVLVAFVEPEHGERAVGEETAQVSAAL